ncbi:MULTISPECIES: hypothetical protein [unclassified Paraburkholderia]|uniref:hypothetical protein n=1 Tax=unclassified Paraburkholderia TaxID=2615204 RepID=UPI002AB77D3A|nr:MULTISPECIES: hypothetical protein [unclassified Paraburkholderia]
MPPVYDVERTGLLLLGPANDFLSGGGKLSVKLCDFSAAVRLLENVRTTVEVVREREIHVLYVSHRRWQPRD